jgi:hypothetical protein
MKTLQFKIGKIVGSPDHHFWSQTHVFMPEDKQKRADYGCLFVSIALKARQDKLDMLLFGKEVISRLHEIYFSSEEQSTITKLKTSIKKLVNEFDKQVRVEVSAAVVVEADNKAIGYFAATSKASCFIYRQESLVEILETNENKIKSASGFIKSKDIIITGTSQFFNIIALGTLKAALQSHKVRETVENLSSVVHGHVKNSQSAAVVFKLMIIGEKKPGAVVLTSPETVSQEDGVKENKLKSAVSGLSAGSTKLKNFFTRLKLSLPKKQDLSSIRIKDEQRQNKAKKTTLTVAVILIGLLIVSVIFGSKKQSITEQTQVVESVLSEASYKYDQAITLKDLNPLRARLLLTEAKQEIEQNLDSIKDEGEKQKLKDLLFQVESALESVAKEYQIEEAKIFQDLGLVKENFSGDDWAMVENIIYIFDQDLNTVLQFDVGNKSAKVVGGGDKLESGQLIGASGTRIFVKTPTSILTIDSDRTELIDEQEAEGWGNIKDLVGFASNAYLLDSSQGQIWKYNGLPSGLADKSEYLDESQSLDQAVSMAIDGSIWVLFEDGRIVKFVRGKEDVFNPTGLESDFSQAYKIYTDENLDNLYIIDRRNTKVIVINKDTGEYQASYVWPGIAGVNGLVVLEDQGLILLLAGQRIYEIELRN